MKYVLFSKYSLATVGLNHFFKSQPRCSQWIVHLSSNFSSCPERLCVEIGQTLRKDDSCASLWSSTIQLYTVCVNVKNRKSIQCRRHLDRRQNMVSGRIRQLRILPNVFLKSLQTILSNSEWYNSKPAVFLSPDVTMQ